METLPLSIPFALATYYQKDARDFLQRFDTLWELMHPKSGRIKSFIDLLMACECVLKSHVFLGRLNEDAYETYPQVRKTGHNVRALSEMAAFMKDRTLYGEVSDKLAPFDVGFRYSLDAWETLILPALEGSAAKIDYSKTIGNNGWVLGVREQVNLLIQETAEALTGIANTDLAAILKHEAEMNDFVRKILKFGN